MSRREGKLRQILKMTRDVWDKPDIPPSARRNFSKALACGTLALGAEVYSSGYEERICPHTCKSKACASCGYRGTLDWQRNQWVALPDVPFVGITLTMPHHYWPIVKANRIFGAIFPRLGPGPSAIGSGCAIEFDR